MTYETRRVGLTKDPVNGASRFLIFKKKCCLFKKSSLVKRIILSDCEDRDG